jgi:LytS/YehU family sensor histidine kinase
VFPALIFKFPKHSDAHLIYIAFLLLSVFYINTLYLIPKFLAKGKLIYYLIFVLLILGATYASASLFNKYFDAEMPFRSKQFTETRAIADYIMGKLQSNDIATKEKIMKDIQTFREKRRITMPARMVILAIIIFTISTAFKITQEWIRNEKRLRENDAERMNAELHFLKSQVNPHFLFNTLNSIYSLAYKRSETTHHAIAKLSNILRYMLYETDVKTVSLENEYQYLKDYIDLQKLRLYDNTRISFETEGNLSSIRIAPMLLVPFVENAFKHGVDNTSDCYIRIRMEVNNHDLLFIVENSVPDKIVSGKDVSSGIGLQNVKRRLKLLYPDNHLLLIDETDNTYSIKLNIRLSGYELHNS